MFQIVQHYLCTSISELLVLFDMVQARSQDRFWEVWNPQNVDILDAKSGLSEPHPHNPLTNTPFCG